MDKKILISIITSITLLFNGCGGDGKDKINFNKDENPTTSKQKLIEDNQGNVWIDIGKNIDKNTKNNLNIYALNYPKKLTYIDTNGRAVNIGEGKILDNGNLQLKNGEIIKKSYKYTFNGYEYILENGRIYRKENINGIERKYYITDGYIDKDGNIKPKNKMILDIKPDISFNNITIEGIDYINIKDNILYDETSNKYYSYTTDENNNKIISDVLITTVTINGKNYKKIGDNLLLDEATGFYYNYSLDSNNNIIVGSLINGEGEENILIEGKTYKKIDENKIIDEETGNIYSVSTSSNGNKDLNLLYKNAKIENGKIYFFIDNDSEKTEDLLNNGQNEYMVSYLDKDGNIYYEKEGTVYKKNFKTGNIEEISKGNIINSELILENEEKVPVILKVNPTLDSISTLAYSVLRDDDLNKYVDFYDNIYFNVSDEYQYIGNAKIVNSYIYLQNNKLKIHKESSDNNYIVMTSKLPNGNVYKSVLGKLYEKKINDKYFIYIGNGSIDDNGLITYPNNETQQGTRLFANNIDIGQTYSDADANLYADINGKKIKIDKYLNIINLPTNYDIKDQATKDMVINLEGDIIISHDGITKSLITNNGIIKTKMIGAVTLSLDEKNDIKIKNSENSNKLNINLVKKQIYNINGNIIEGTIIEKIDKTSTPEKTNLNYNIIDGKIKIDLNNNNLVEGEEYEIKGEGQILTNDNQIYQSNDLINNKLEVNNKSEAPVVLSITPTSKSLVLVNTSIHIYFNQKIKKESVNSTNIVFTNNRNYKQDSDIIMGKENEIIIIPKNNLSPNTEYNVLIKNVASLNKDVKMNGDFKYTFKTSNAAVLQIVNISTLLGADNLTKPGSPITLTLNYPIENFNNEIEENIIMEETKTGKKIDIYVSQPTENTILIKPNKPLKNFTDYTIKTALIEELDANGNIKNKENYITIGSDNMSMLINTYPVNGSHNFVISDNIELYYNNQLDALNTPNLDFKLIDNNTRKEYKLNVVYNTKDKKITINAPVDMVPQHNFTLKIPEIKDANGNIIGENTINFYTKDTIPPKLIDKDPIFPAEGELNFDFNQNITISFTEKLSSASINSNNVYILDKKTKAKIIGPQINLSNNIISIDASNNLKENEEYELFLSKNIEDLSGNKFNFDKKITFKTYDITPPLINIQPHILEKKMWDITKGKVTYFELILNEKTKSINSNNLYIRPTSNYKSTADNIEASISYEQIQKTDTDGNVYYVDNPFKLIIRIKQDIPAQKSYYLVLNNIKDESGNSIRDYSVTYGNSGSTVNGVKPENRDGLGNIIWQDSYNETNIRYIGFSQNDDVDRPYLSSISINTSTEKDFNLSFSENVLIDTNLPTSFKIEDGNDNYKIMDSTIKNGKKDWVVSLNSYIPCNDFVRFRITNVYDLSYNKLASGSGVTSNTNDTFYEPNICFRRTCSTNYTGGSDYTGSDTTNGNFNYSKKLRHDSNDNIYVEGKNGNIYKIYPNKDIELIGQGKINTSNNNIDMANGTTISTIVEEQLTGGGYIYTIGGTKKVPNSNGLISNVSKLSSCP